MILQEDRTQVQTLLGVNMVVEAGAGTGKTTLLIDRLCLAILVRCVSVEKLVALTFTEKAAAEIKTRLIFKLQTLVKSVRENTTDRTLSLLREHFSISDEDILSRAECALARLDRAGIGTIHGFCADILKAFPLEAGLSPHAEIDPGQKGKRIFEIRWNSFLDQELGLSASRALQWKSVLPEIPLPALKDFARQLCSGKIDHYDYFAHREKLCVVCEEKSRQALEWSEAFLEGKKMRNTERALQWAAASLRRTAAFLRGEGIPPSPEEEAPTFPSLPPKGWDERTFEEARALVSFSQKVVPEKQQLFLSALELVAPVVQEVRADYSREGILSFDDLIVKTRNLLQNNLYVRRLLKEKFDVLFIDEFQDTDPVQGELLLFLAEEKSSSASSWREVKLEPGKLVVVGDPKQSIYRFRGADITAYELFSELILKQGGKKCFLQKNFRSTSDIIATANAVCSQAMVQEVAFQPAYVPIFTDKVAGNPTVKWLFVAPPKEETPLADDFRHNQARQIVHWIEQNVGKLELSNGRKLAYKDIALLSRASTTAGPYIEALRRASIPFNVETDKDFYRKQEVSDLLNLLRVLANPVDKTSLVGVLRSPFGGFTDEEIYRISCRGELSVYASPSSKRLSDFYGLIRSLIDKAGRVSLQELLHEILLTTFLPEACASSYDGEQTLANLQRLVRLAEGYICETPLSLNQFLSAIQDLLENEPERLGDPLADESLQAVSILTVHKSKGLEFPVVILTDLSKRESSSSAEPAGYIFSWQYNMHGLRAGKICDINLAFLEEEQKKHGRCEEVRVLYVALTRAKEQLLLVADGRKGAEKAARAFSACGLFPTGNPSGEVLSVGGRPLPVLCAPYEKPETFIYRQEIHEKEGNILPDLACWRQAFQTRKARYQQQMLEEDLAPSKQEGTSLFTEEQRAGAEVGTVCHRALELLLSGKESDPVQAVASAARLSGFPLRETAVQEVLFPFLQSSLYQEISAASVLACEMPFSFVDEEGRLFSGIMDAVLKKSDGTVWVLDYKTDRLKAGEESVLFEKYRSQLQIYKQAAQKIFKNQKLCCSAVWLRTFASTDL